MLCMIRGRHPAARSRRRVRVVGGQSLEWVCACSPHPASVRMSLRKPRGGASQRFWVGYGSVIGITMGFLTRAHVMENVFLELTLTLGLILGAIWFTALTNRLQRSLDQIENGDQMLDEIRESIEIVGQILNRLPELMPQFNMPQTNPLATLIESYFESIVGSKVSKTDGTPRGVAGRFIDGGTTWEEEGGTPPPSEADAESDPGA